jgi:DNA topoisomerase-3
MWKIVAGRQLEVPEAETLLTDREVGPLEGFRSKLGRPFTAKLKLNDVNETQFDFGDGAIDAGDAEAPDFSGQDPLGPCPKCGSKVFEMPAAYVCEKAVGPERTCDFRSGRVILQRPVDRTQMQKLLATGKTDLLQFVSSRTRRPFSAYLVRQSDGKIGFEFEAKNPAGRSGRGARAITPLRVLGSHPKDKKPVELHSGRYGPYVKHGAVNATVPDRERVDALTLDEALMLLAAKSGKAGFKPAAASPSVAAAKAPRKSATGRTSKKPPRVAEPSKRTKGTARRRAT